MILTLSTVGRETANRAEMFERELTAQFRCPLERITQLELERFRQQANIAVTDKSWSALIDRWADLVRGND
jgi:hypothetical protein